MAKKAKKAAKKAAPKAKKTAARAKKPAGVKPIPDGYPRLMAYTVVSNAGQAIDFFKNVFGAKERMRMPTPDGRIAHAEVQFGDSVLMLADDIMGQGTRALGLCFYTESCDAIYQKALAAGATSKVEPRNEFYGDRQARFIDPFGNEWSVMTHVEDVSEAEMMKRMEAMAQQMGGQGQPPSGQAA